MRRYTWGLDSERLPSPFCLPCPALQVRQLQEAVQQERAQVAALAAATASKDAEAARLREEAQAVSEGGVQARPSVAACLSSTPLRLAAPLLPPTLPPCPLPSLLQAAEEARRELSDKDAALAALQAEAAASREGMQQDVAALQQQLQGEVAAKQAALAQQAEAAAAADATRLADLRGAQEQSGLLQARVASLSDHTQRLEAELAGTRSREQQLQEELQAAKRAAAALQRSPSKLIPGVARPGAVECKWGLPRISYTPGRVAAQQPPASASPCPSAAISPVASRTLSEQYEVGAGLADAAAASLPGGITTEHASAVEALAAAAVQQRLQMVPVPLGGAGLALRIPLSSWLLCESLIRWAGAWQAVEIDSAADTLQRAIVDAARGGGLRGQVRVEAAGGMGRGVACGGCRVLWLPWLPCSPPRAPATLWHRHTGWPAPWPPAGCSSSAPLGGGRAATCCAWVGGVGRWGVQGGGAGPAPWLPHRTLACPTPVLLPPALRRRLADQLHSGARGSGGLDCRHAARQCGGAWSLR